MINFNEANVTIDGNFLGKITQIVFNQSKDSAGKTIFNVIATVDCGQDYAEINHNWKKNNWHNYGQKVEGLDESFLVSFLTNVITFNRAFMYAPYGGVSFSSLRYAKIKAFTYLPELLQDAQLEFIANNSTFKLLSEGNSVLGPYAIYVKK